MRLEVLIWVLLKSQVFWDMMLNYVVNISKCFEGSWCGIVRCKRCERFKKTALTAWTLKIKALQFFKAIGNYSPSIMQSCPRRLESFCCCLQIDLWSCCSFVSLPSTFKLHCSKFWSCCRVQIACGALSLSLHVSYAAEPYQRLFITFSCTGQL
jgi:hypothetical protein